MAHCGKEDIESLSLLSVYSIWPVLVFASHCKACMLESISVWDRILKYLLLSKYTSDSVLPVPFAGPSPSKRPAASKIIVILLWTVVLFTGVAIFFHLFS